METTKRTRLKVNPDNTINIKPVEETWRDIIINLNVHIPDELLEGLIESLQENYQVPKQLKK